MRLPNRWGPGTIFALSGYAHQTTHARPFIATPTAERLGLRFRLAESPTLWFGDASCTPDKLDPAASVCSNEVLSLRVGEQSLEVVHLDQYTLISRATAALRPSLEQGGRAVSEVALPSGALALVVEPADGGVRFALSYAESLDSARSQAAAGVQTDLDGLVAERLNDLRELPVPEGLSELQERTYRKACAIMRVNVESPQGPIPCRWTTPDRWPHRHMWLWDSAFHAVGWRWFDVRLAEEAILAKLAMVGPDGYLPHMTAPDPRIRSVDTTQPPILGWAAEHVLEAGGSNDFVLAAFEPLQRYLAWHREHRARPETEGLVGWRIHDVDPLRAARGGESGWDNSPRFDTCLAMTAVDFSCQVERELAALGRLAVRLGLTDIAWQYASEATRFRTLINHYLWDDEDGFYYDLDEHGERLRVKAGSGFTPLWSGSASQEQAARLVEHLTDPNTFGRPFPMPSLAADEPSYCDDMWRGPTWLNYDLLLYEGLRGYGYHDLAENLARKLVSEVSRWYGEDGTIYEYYDAEAKRSPGELHRKGGVGEAGGTGFGVIRDYHWSAAVYVDLCWRLAGGNSLE